MAFDKILVVDDELVIRKSIASHFQKKRYKVASAESISEAERILAKDQFDFILLDERLPDGLGSDLIEGILQNQKIQTFIVMMSAHTTVEGAIRAVKMGAFDYILKPFSITQIEIALKRAETYDRLEKVNQYFNEELNQTSELIGNCKHMLQLKRLIQKVAATEATVLVTGENGTGKELVARELYRMSSLSKRPFIKVNCAAMSESLIESEFFGHEKGSFTGANTRRLGRFELADTGTIMLDEIGELSPRIQAKLLRVLQEKEFERVGGTKTISVKVRVIATTNRNLLESVQKGEFREDLYYRLSVFPIEVPPLRDRNDDVLLLTHRFLNDFNAKHGNRVNGISDEARRMLLSHLWPGNVRELQNTIERAVILSDPDQALQADTLNIQGIQSCNPSEYLQNTYQGSTGGVPPIYNKATLTVAKINQHQDSPALVSEAPESLSDNSVSVEVEEPHNHAAPIPQPLEPIHDEPSLTSLEEIERYHIFKTLEKTAGNRAQAADILKISTTLRNKLNQYKQEGFTVDF